MYVCTQQDYSIEFRNNSSSNNNNTFLSSKQIHTNNIIQYFNTFNRIIYLFIHDQIQSYKKSDFNVF